MNTHECRSMRLAEYVDGELSGNDRRLVSRHLEGCSSCALEARSLRQVGDMLRQAVDVDPAPAQLDGLAGGVVSRFVAERAQSWRGMVDRATDDWHWFLVGFGSVTAAFISITFVSAIVAFGPRPERQDSLSALLSSRDWQIVNSAGGSLYIWASPVEKQEWLEVRNKIRKVTELAAAADPSLKGMTTEGEFVGELGERLTAGSAPLDLSSMEPGLRLRTEMLLSRVKELRGLEYPPIYDMRLVTSTQVTAKGL